jgi:hypothetical protein
MALPEGWEFGPDGRVRKRHGRQVFDLSGLEIDEVGFVSSGANQRAHIVLSKEDSGQESPMPTEDIAADPYGPAATRYSDAKELAKMYTDDPWLYDREHAPVIKRSAVPTMLAEIAKSSDPKAIAALLDRYPSLYDALVKAGE